MRQIRGTYNKFTVSCSIVNDDFTIEEFNTLSRAVRHMAIKLGSEEFKNFCESYRYSFPICSGWLWWKKCVNRVVHNFKYSNGRSSAEVYKHLMGGKETLSDRVDGEADIVLVIDRRNKRNVIGYTYPNTVKQWVYSWFLKTDYKRVAGNLAHEWVHKMGYDHKFRYNSTRRHTVPYAVGDFVAEIGR